MHSKGFGRSTQHAAEKLLHAVINNISLQSLIDLAAEILRNPVILIDAGYHLLAFASEGPVDDPIWREIEQNGFWCYDTVATFKAEKIIDKVVNADAPQLIDWGIAQKTRRISTKVLLGDTIVGHFAVLETHRPFVGDEVELLDLISKVIASELQKPLNVNITQGMAYEAILGDLLDGRITDAEAICSELNAFGWNMSGTMYLLLVNIEKFDPTRSLAAVVRTAMEQRMPGARSVVYQKQVLVLLESSRSLALPANTLADIEAFLHQENMHASLSQSFTHIIDLPRFYEQARSLLAIGAKVSPASSLYTYDDYGVYAMIHLCNKTRNIAEFCHPALPALREHDTKNGTAYFNTLWAYLLHARSLGRTAQALFVHRNTLRYRLDKIAGITGLDMDNDALLSQLYLSYKIYEYSGRL